MVPAGCLTPTAKEVRTTKVVQGFKRSVVQQPASCNSQDLASKLKKNRDADYYPEHRKD
jgi:hypothetical protein